MSYYYSSASSNPMSTYPHHNRMAKYFEALGVGCKSNSKTTRSMSYSTSSRTLRPPEYEYEHPAYLSSPVSSYSSSSQASQPYAPTNINNAPRLRTRTYSAPNLSYTVDSLLKYHPNPADVRIKYNLSHPPSQATLIYPGSSSLFELSESEFNRPATYPPLQKMRISCPLLPWPITLYPASETRAILTVGDVLEGLFRFLRKHASGEEWHSADERTREDVRQSWMRRVRRQPTHKDKEYERSNGLRRIDWLEKATVFQGLEPVKRTDTWILHVRHADKTVKFWTGS